MTPARLTNLRRIYWITIVVCLATTAGLMVYLVGTWDFQPEDLWPAFWLFLYALSPYLALALAGRWLARHPVQIALLWLGAALNLAYQLLVIHDTLRNGLSLLDRILLLLLIALPSLQLLVVAGAIALALGVGLYLRYARTKHSPTQDG